MTGKKMANINERLPVETTAMSVEMVNQQVQLIQQVMRQVMKENEHYGIIPGTNKPTLLKSGAEKLCLTFRLNPDYEIIDPVRNDTFIAYTVKCILKHINTGNVIASGIGSCNSRETKYRFRWESTGREVSKDYWKHRDQTLLGGSGFKPLKIEGTYFIAERTENLNPWDLDNTLIKMACKRALVAATLNATAASDIFTQDLEDSHETATPSTNGKKTKDPKFEQHPQEPSKDTDKTPPPPESESTVEDNAKALRGKTADLQAKMNEYSDLIKELQMLKLKPASQTTAIVSKAIAMGEDWDGKIEFLRAEIMERKEGGNNGT